MKAVAIDGPAGAGKSTISRKVAQEIGFVYVDTGALYRTVGLYVIGKGADTKNADEVVPLLSEISVEMKFINKVQKIFLNGEDVSDKIRLPEISMAASDVSAIPAVREFLFDMQRSIALKENVVMDGRDIGSVVLPNADVKIFLTASPEDRARRRYEELLSKGVEVDYDTVLEDVKQRDYNDSHRKIAPLCVAEGAVVIDTTGNELEKSVSIMVDTVKKLLNIK